MKVRTRQEAQALAAQRRLYRKRCELCRALYVGTGKARYCSPRCYACVAQRRHRLRLSRIADRGKG